MGLADATSSWTSFPTPAIGDESAPCALIEPVGAAALPELDAVRARLALGEAVVDLATVRGLLASPDEDEVDEVDEPDEVASPPADFPEVTFRDDGLMVDVFETDRLLPAETFDPPDADELDFDPPELDFGAFDVALGEPDFFDPVLDGLPESAAVLDWRRIRR